MRIGEVAQRCGVSIKAVRYYERLGLLTPARHGNNYRDYDDHDVRVVGVIRELAATGIPAGRAAPFVVCLHAGHEHGDDCPTSLAVYRDAIGELDGVIAELTRRRADLHRRLIEASGRTFATIKGNTAMTDYATLPDNLPVPADDGAADHLPGVRLPALDLPATDATTVDLSAARPGRTVVYLYPLTGQPGIDLPSGWDDIPGARGCSTEACDFRDHFADLQAAGVDRVWGMSSQDVDYQGEVVNRLRLPFPMISDPSLALADALDLPTFPAPGHERLYSRLTLVIRDGRIEHAFYPIFPPNTHAQQVLAWLAANPVD